MKNPVTQVVSRIIRHPRSLSTAQTSLPRNESQSSEISKDGDDLSEQEKALGLPPAAADMSAHQRKRRIKEAEKAHKKEEREAQLEEEARKRKEEFKKHYDQDEWKENYGYLPLNQSQTRSGETYASITEVTPENAGKVIRFQARIQHPRIQGAKMEFLVLRQGIHTVQGVLLAEQSEHVSETMVRWAEKIPRESVVLVEGKIQVPETPVKRTSIHEAEVRIDKLYVISKAADHLPFSVEDASRPIAELEKEDAHFSKLGDGTRQEYRLLDLRTDESQAIFKIQAGVCKLFRRFLEDRGFTEIHTPKLQGAATESGSSVFKVDYFKRPAFLAQSPQLAKQMAIAADMGRVYEIGPVFRAENSNTHRHMTEYTGLDIEMAINEHYHEILDTIDEMFKYLWKGLLTEYRTEVEIVKKQYPHEDIIFPEKSVRIPYKEGIDLLKGSGYEEEGLTLSYTEDISTRAEVRLGQLVKEKYNTDYYILDKFPASVRPFYTMPDPKDPDFCNSFDIFLRGEEILSGGQRIHDADLLVEHLRLAKIDPDDMKEYVDGFRWGAPPHGGAGIGLERVVMLFLKLGNIRRASMFPRDPRSFPAKAAVPATNNRTSNDEARKEQEAADARTLRLEDLIALYGDASNTAWLDKAYQVWRDPATGAAVGYCPSEGYAVIWGNPLCKHSILRKVVTSFLKYITDEKKLKPLWCCVDEATEKALVEDHKWRALTCIAEQRVNPTTADPEADHKTKRKVSRAMEAGVTLKEIAWKDITEEIRKELDERMEDWHNGRNGAQVHTTELRPWMDPEHRRYFIARDKEGKACGMIVLHKLAPEYGWQVKWALEFPDAPQGTSELSLSQVFKILKAENVTSTTFGAGAVDFRAVDNLHGFRVDVLAKAYNAITHTFALTNKTHFREKFQAVEDPLYICYPKHGLGMKGVDAIMKFLKQDK